MSGAKALEAAMEDRAAILGKRWNVVAKDAGMSPQHLLRIRRGETALNVFTAGGIDRALNWPAGRAWAIYTGEDEPELRDDTERQIWGMAAVPPDLRRRFIEQYRESGEHPHRTGTE